jgi:WD40 repeat protein
MKAHKIISLFSLAVSCSMGQSMYTREVAPILQKYCLGCHSASAKLGGLNLQDYGAFSKVIVPGKSVESRLFQLISGKASPAMPMDGRHLADGELRIIQSWIDSGAKGPAPGEAAAAAAAAAPRITPRTPVKPQIFSMAWRPDGKMIALGSFREIRLIDPVSSRLEAALPGHADVVRAVAFSKDGKFLVGGGGLPARKGEIKIWDVERRQLVRTITGHSDCIYAVAISPDGKTIATSSYDKLIKLWDATTGNEIRTLKDHIDAVYALAFSPDGSRLLSGAADRSVKIWNPATGERLYTLSDATDGINAIAIDPTGQMVAAGGLDKSIRIWRLGERGGELVNAQIAHEDAILSLVWSPDGKQLISASGDKTIKVFSAPDLVEIKTIGDQADWVYALQFSPDGHSFAAGRFDGSFTVYHLDRQIAAR